MIRHDPKASLRAMTIAAIALLALAGCRDRAEYDPPGYAPPPPPPARLAATPAAPEPLEKVDPLTLTPKLTDPQDAQGKIADLKSALAGIWEDQLVIKFELYGAPPQGNDVWYLAWLACANDPELLLLQVSLSEKTVVGGVFVEDAKPVESERYSNDVRAEGNSVIVRFPWSKMPEKFQVRDLKLQSPSIIQSNADKTGTDLVDEIAGFDHVRS